MKYLLTGLLVLCGCTSNTPTKKFKVGDCVSIEGEKYIERIEEVGETSYQTSIYDASRKEWFLTNISLPFYFSMSGVQCPTEGVK